MLVAAFSFWCGVSISNLDTTSLCPPFQPPFAVNHIRVLQPAGMSYSCISSGATGNINVIDASYVPLTNGVMAQTPARTLSCPSGTLSSSCTEPEAGTDAWVFLSWKGASPSGGHSAFTCSAGGTVVCSWSSAGEPRGVGSGSMLSHAQPPGAPCFAATGAADASSCSFLLAGSAGLTCDVSAGAVAFAAASRATDLALSPYGTTTREATPPCPAAGPAPNDCDCSFQSAANATDTLVTIVSESVDAGFNSFHCGYDGVNVCGWGSNSGMNFSVSEAQGRGRDSSSSWTAPGPLPPVSQTGSCSFIVPPGGTYECQMEWGAAAFPYTSVVATRASVFPAAFRSAASRPAPLPGTPAAAVVSAAEAARLAALFTAWVAEHNLGPLYPPGSGAAAAALDAFASHVAAVEDSLRRCVRR